MLNFIAGLFVGFTWYIWVPFIIFVIGICSSTYHQSWKWTTVLALFIGCIFAYLHLDVLRNSDTWLSIVKYGGIYIAIGFVWGVIAWTLFVYEKRKCFNELAAKWDKEHPNPSSKYPEVWENSPQEREIVNWRFERLAWINAEAGHYMECYRNGSIANHRVIRDEENEAVKNRKLFLDSLGSSDLAPHPKYYKETIGFEIVWWPFSIFWALLNDMPEKIWNTLTTIVSRVYRMINERIFSSVKV